MRIWLSILLLLSAARLSATGWRPCHLFHRSPQHQLDPFPSTPTQKIGPPRAYREEDEKKKKASSRRKRRAQMATDSARHDSVKVNGDDAAVLAVQHTPMDDLLISPSPLQSISPLDSEDPLRDWPLPPEEACCGYRCCGQPLGSLDQLCRHYECCHSQDMALMDSKPYDPYEHLFDHELQQTVVLCEEEAPCCPYQVRVPVMEIPLLSGENRDTLQRDENHGLEEADLAQGENEPIDLDEFTPAPAEIFDGGLEVDERLRQFIAELPAEEMLRVITDIEKDVEALAEQDDECLMNDDAAYSDVGAEFGSPDAVVLDDFEAGYGEDEDDGFDVETEPDESRYDDSMSHTTQSDNEDNTEEEENEEGEGVRLKFTDLTPPPRPSDVGSQAESEMLAAKPETNETTYPPLPSPPTTPIDDPMNMQPEDTGSPMFPVQGVLGKGKRSLLQGTDHAGLVGCKRGLDEDFIGEKQAVEGSEPGSPKRCRLNQG